MANGGGVELAVAAMKGGVLGSLPCGMLTADQIREQVDEVRNRASGPVNVNFLCHKMPDQVNDSAWRARLQPYYDEFAIAPEGPAPLRMPFGDTACAAVEELKPEVVSFHYGLPPNALFDRVKASGQRVRPAHIAKGRGQDQRNAERVGGAGPAGGDGRSDGGEG